MSITPEVQDTRQKLRHAADDLSHAAEDLAQATKASPGRAAKAVASGVGTLRERTRETTDRARDQLQATQRKAIDTIRERPAITAATAFGLGLAAGAALVACLFANERVRGAGEDFIRNLRR